MPLCLPFECLNGHTWEIWWTRYGVGWRLMEMNPECGLSRKTVQAEGLDEYDEIRAENALSLEEMDAA